MASQRSATLLSAAIAGIALLVSDLPAFGDPPPPPLDAGGDDLFLLQAATSPNVVLFVDNSQSMNHIEWHPAFDPEAAPDASYCASSSDFGGSLDPDTVYPLPGDVNASCDSPSRSTRKVYAPNNPTYWSGRYLMWYLGLDTGDPADAEILDEIKFAEAQVEGCTQASGAKFFAEKYRRTRFEATQQVLLDLLCLAEPKNVRFASAVFREVADDDLEDANGGYISTDLGRSNPNHAAELEAAIKNEDPTDTDATPLSETLFQLYTYWMPRDATQMPVGADGLTQFPIYQYDKFGNFESDSNNWFEDTLLFDCEKAFFVVVTDGMPSYDDFDDDPANTALGFPDFQSLIGNYHTDAETEDPGADDEATFFLDDIAKYMFDKDFRPDLGGDQTIDTYTVGFAANTATDDFLERTAQLGNGVFYDVQDGDELTFALIGALNDIIEKAASFTAATVPSARTEDGADFYQSYFFPRGKSAFWEGHVRAWKIDGLGNILDKNGDCALDDPDPGECNSGPFRNDAEFFWDAANEVPAPALRSLYVSKSGVTGGALPPAFTQANITAADLGVSVFTSPPDQSPNDPLYEVNGSTATSEEGLADEIVAAVRGCFFGTGVSSNVATPSTCAARPSRLGDIFHSNAVVVRGPSQRLGETSYEAFKSHYATRKRVFYAGTNAGFLEALHTGDWVTTPTPPHYDEGTGTELFGFMPWEARAKIRNLPIDAATSRNHYVDGDVNSADVWIHPTPTTSAKNPNGSEWRTLVVSALREGGHHYVALDVTNPNGQTQAGGGTALPFPGYAWEFPKEADPAGDFADMGETWGKPILTKVRVKVGADDNSGAGYERWVAIVTAGYDPTSDPNPDEVTGITSTYDATSTKGRGVYVIDVKTGQVLAEKKFGSLADPQTNMLFSVVAAPAVFDLNFDGFADTVFIATMGGQIFKWSIGAIGEDRVNDLSGLRTQPDWPFKLFFQAAPVTIGSGAGAVTYHKNFFFAPAAALVRGKLFLAFGSGERRNLPFPGDTDDTGEENRFYVVVDPDPFEQASPSLGTVTESDLTDFSGSDDAATFTNRGFFFSVADGEKFVTNVEIFSGKVIAASFKPTTSPDPCVTRGDGTLYVFDLVTGEGHFVDGGGNADRSLSLGPGLPTDPKISVGVGGKNNKVVIEKSGADIEIIDEEDIDLGGSVLYWRERD